MLFDNIDKGWPATGVTFSIYGSFAFLWKDSTRSGKTSRAQGREYMSVVFLRNDIYELLVEGTPDRQKAGQVRIDWTDRAKLHQVIHSRVQASRVQAEAKRSTKRGKIFRAEGRQPRLVRILR